MGGVLFIDEAYSLTSQEGVNDFGKEAIEILLKNMEDHRDDLIVIVVSYTNLMQQFIHTNPGLESRFNKYFYFEDYSADQLLSILESQCRRNSYTPLRRGKRKKLQSCWLRPTKAGTKTLAMPGRCATCLKSWYPANLTGSPPWNPPTKEDLMLLTEADFDAAAGEPEAE